MRNINLHIRSLISFRFFCPLSTTTTTTTHLMHNPRPTIFLRPPTNQVFRSRMHQTHIVPDQKIVGFVSCCEGVFGFEELQVEADVKSGARKNMMCLFG